MHAAPVLIPKSVFMCPQEKVIKAGHLYNNCIHLHFKLHSSCSVYTIRKTQLSKQEYNPNADKLLCCSGLLHRIFYILKTGHVKYAFLFLQSNSGVNTIQL